VTANTSVRQALVQEHRSSAYSTLGSVYDEVERQTGSTFRPPSTPRAAVPLATHLTQVCWLNGTLRTQAPPEVLADVAAAPEVSALDVPVRLRADAAPTNLQTVRYPPFAVETGLTGKGVVVGVIDSEVALGHPALIGRVVHRRNYTVESWGFPGEHGTAVAGIVAAEHDVHTGMAPEATIYSYKVLATNALLNGDDFDGVLAIQQALEDGVDVVNCSWGMGPAGDGTGRNARALDTAWDLGLTIVKSAGNAGPGAGTMTSPADARGVVVVGATDLSGRTVAGYSSRGTAGAHAGPDVVAPGGLPGATIACAVVGGGFGEAGYGTSYAAPHVAGLVCTYLQRAPSLLPEQVRGLLTTGTVAVPGVGVEVQGQGLLQCR
jgi:serine protease AprX